MEPFRVRELEIDIRPIVTHAYVVRAERNPNSLRNRLDRRYQLLRRPETTCAGRLRNLGLELSMGDVHRTDMPREVDDDERAPCEILASTTASVSTRFTAQP